MHGSGSGIEKAFTSSESIKELSTIFLHNTQQVPDPRTVCSMLLAAVEEMELQIMGCKDEFHIKGTSVKFSVTLHVTKARKLSRNKLLYQIRRRSLCLPQSICMFPFNANGLTCESASIRGLNMLTVGAKLMSVS